MAQIKPFGKRILIKLKEEETTTASGIILTDDSKSKNENLFEVIEVGPEVTLVHPGDLVIVGARYGDSVNFHGTEYKIIIEDAILSILNP
jgi:chaperonin GroES